jgi:hypothetical protein
MLLSYAGAFSCAETTPAADNPANNKTGNTRRRKGKMVFIVPAPCK